MIVTEYTIYTDNPALPEMGLRAVLVSDLHEHNGERAAELVKEIRPDLICVAGDTFEREAEVRAVQGIRPGERLWGAFKGLLRSMEQKNRCPENAYRFLREISGIAPVFLSLGNHDLYLSGNDQQVLKECGICLLDNGFIRWKGLAIGGFSTWGNLDWLDEYTKCPEYKLLLCHRPEFYPQFIREREVDLTLCGHAHGGQIRLFGRGLFAPGQGFFPKYDYGMYEGRCIVSAGCANTVAIPRWGNPEEIVSIEIVHPERKEKKGVDFQGEMR